MTATLAAGLIAGFAGGLAGGAAATAETRSLAGQFLIARSGLEDPYFSRSVVIVLSHDETGALGLILNRVMTTTPLPGLLRTLKMEDPAARAFREIRVHFGGPVEPSRFFILHSEDFRAPLTQTIAKGVAITPERLVLQALARGQGPRDVVFALGYAGWAPGQLERELEREDWLVVPADPALVFGDEPERLWERAVARARVPL